MEYNVVYKYNELEKETIMNVGKIRIKDNKFYIKGYKEYIEEKITKCKLINVNGIGTIIKIETYNNDIIYTAITRVNIKGKFLIINFIKTVSLKNEIDKCI